MNWHCEWVRRVSFRSDVLLLYFLSTTEPVQFFQTSIRCEGKIKNCRDAIFSEKCSFLLSGTLESVKYVIFTLLEKKWWHAAQQGREAILPCASDTPVWFQTDILKERRKKKMQSVSQSESPLYQHERCCKEMKSWSRVCQQLYLSCT